VLALVFVSGCAEPVEPWETSTVEVEVLVQQPPRGPYDPLVYLLNVCTERRWDRRVVQDQACSEDEAGAGVCGEEEVCERRDNELRPVVVGPAPVELAELGAANRDGEPFGWIPLGGWEAGGWQVVGMSDDASGETLEIEEGPFFETRPGVEPNWSTWRVGTWWSPDLFAVIARSYAGDVWLVVDEPSDEVAGFHIVASPERDGERCIVLAGTGRVVDGTLSWERDELRANSDPPLTSTDLWFDATFFKGGTGSGNAHLMADMGEWKVDPDTEALCSLLAGVGTPCETPCPDGTRDCLDVRLYAVELTRTAEVNVSDLPVCGFDDTIEAPEWGCDVDWSDIDLCSTAGLVGLGWPTALVAIGLVRRRRQED
jgi:hypothetical protein